MKCRHCEADLSLLFIDLGTAPPSNSYLDGKQLSAPEKWYPLRVYTCTTCWLVQTEDYAHHSEFFSNDYAYFSSFSTSWLAHAKNYVDKIVPLFGLSSSSRVVEVASNDGYLLQYLKERAIPCLGVEPTASTATAARQKGLEVVEDFFGVRLATLLVADGWTADLTVANNVLAHVPDINDFVAGFGKVLAPDGVSTFEFPHLLRLIQFGQFDTIYHEHFSYLSLTAVQRVFERNGLAVFDVEEIDTHGGSLRVYAQRLDLGRREVKASVGMLLAHELAAGVASEECYRGFQSRVENIKHQLLKFLLEIESQRESIGGYGAAAKGNTLLNYCGVRADLVPYVVDRNPVKIGKFLPGSRIPIFDEEFLRKDKPAYVFIFPWNIKDEVVQQLSYIREWGGKFVCAVPELTIF